jgi:hypothetical protein
VSASRTSGFSRMSVLVTWYSLRNGDRPTSMMTG